MKNDLVLHQITFKNIQSEILKLKNPRTREAYNCAFKAYIRYSNDNPSKNIVDFILYMQAQVHTGEISPATYNQRISGLKFILKLDDRAYHLFLKQIKDMNINLKFNIPLEDKTCKAFTFDELKIVLDYCNKHEQYFQTGLLLRLLTQTGLRISEALQIKKSDVVANGDFVDVSDLIGKGSKIIGCTFRKDLYESILKLHPDKPFLFYSQRGSHEPWTRFASTKSIKTVFQKVIGKQYGAHACRHSLGTHLAEQKVPLNVIAKLLRHHSVETTVAFYLHNSLDKKLIPAV